MCSKVWEGAFNQNVLAAYDDAGTSKMTWSAEQILMKDLEDFMNVAQNASKYVKPEWGEITREDWICWLCGTITSNIIEEAIEGML